MTMATAWSTSGSPPPTEDRQSLLPRNIRAPKLPVHRPAPGLSDSAPPPLLPPAVATASQSSPLCSTTQAASCRRSSARPRSNDSDEGPSERSLHIDLDAGPDVCRRRRPSRAHEVEFNALSGSKAQEAAVECGLLNGVGSVEARLDTRCDTIHVDLDIKRTRGAWSNTSNCYRDDTPRPGWCPCIPPRARKSCQGRGRSLVGWDVVPIPTINNLPSET